MAQYTPKAWTAVSPEASGKFRERYSEILKLVQQKARKYFNMSSIATADLVQEGLIAALYAVDSYDPSRGKMDAYIGTNVNNAMMMILAESRAQCRQPYTWVKAEDDSTPAPAPAKTSATDEKPAVKKQEENWRRVPAMDFSDPDTVLDKERLTPLEQREAEIERLDRAEASRVRLAEVRATLGPVAALVFDVRCEPPPVVFTIARNLSGRSWTDKQKLPANAIAKYLGVTPSQVDQALRDIKAAVERRYNERTRREVMR